MLHLEVITPSTVNINIKTLIIEYSSIWDDFHYLLSKNTSKSIYFSYNVWKRYPALTDSNTFIINDLIPNTRYIIRCIYSLNGSPMISDNYVFSTINTSTIITLEELSISPIYITDTDLCLKINIMNPEINKNELIFWYGTKHIGKHYKLIDDNSNILLEDLQPNTEYRMYCSYKHGSYKRQSEMHCFRTLHKAIEVHDEAVMLPIILPTILSTILPTILPATLRTYTKKISLKRTYSTILAKS
ncbi:MAG: hypothetical protein Gaeavirus1_2 [Gaeavirus sp.]|uniref:Uncharacterized protein n=1 Tax=Gaeavirus sp. TaxID=2487767 RepID=A0A3G4ZY72_9VIRU|nr:MAG: hypothetical protein Gaeavirus1_2 [Gaeavirus sp.]